MCYFVMLFLSPNMILFLSIHKYFFVTNRFYQLSDILCGFCLHWSVLLLHYFYFHNRILSFQVWFFKHFPKFGLTSQKEDIICELETARFFISEADSLLVPLCSFKHLFPLHPTVFKLPLTFLRTSVLIYTMPSVYVFVKVLI